MSQDMGPITTDDARAAEVEREALERGRAEAPAILAKMQDRQTTVYSYTNTPEPPPVAPANARHSSKTAEHFSPPEVVERARAVLGGIDLDPFSTPEANERITATTFFDGEERGGINGFKVRWTNAGKGVRVFCNPPGGRTYKNRSSQKRAWFKLAEEYAVGRRGRGDLGKCINCGALVEVLDLTDAGCSCGCKTFQHAECVRSAVFVCFSVELLQSTQVKTPDGLPLPLDFPICYPAKRVRYLSAEGKVGKSPPHASCLILLPERLSSGAWSMVQVEKFVAVFGELGRVVVPWRQR